MVPSLKPEFQPSSRVNMPSATRLAVSRVALLTAAFLVTSFGAACAFGQATYSSTTTANASPNPVYPGQTATLSATVTSTSGNPTGTVSFYYGTAELGSATLSNGFASISASSQGLPTGSYVVTANYSGDANFEPSSGTVTVTLDPADATTTTLSVTPNPAYIGQTVTLTATVNSNIGYPSGSVNFIYQGQVLGTATLVNGVGTFSASTSTLSSGAYIVSAQYTGNQTFAPSSSAATQVSIGNASTTTTLSTTTPVITPPGNVSLTATVARTSGTGTPTGTVTFSYSGGTLATVALNSAGVAAFTAPTTGVAVGQYAINASYSGDASDKASSATALTLTVAGLTSVSVTVNPLANRHTISPLIYGTNFPPSTSYILNTNSTLTRWAGDASSGYNWQTGNTNLASDYFFANYPFNSTEPLYKSSQAYVSGVASTGAAPVMSINMLPWVAKDASSYSFSVAKYGAQCKTEPYNSDEGNGQETNCSTDITTNDPNDAYFPLLDSPGTNDPANSLYRSQWVAALVPQFGNGPHYYGIDNEPEIWNDVHWDVHPNPTTYAEMRNLFVTEIPNIKQWDPQAKVLAPGSSGWYFYWNDTSFGADKTAHANLDYNPWLLNEIYWNDLTNGTRTMDWYDLHAYPDGNETGYTHAQVQALALRVLRDFWDPSYQGEGGDVDQQYVTNLQPNRTYAFRIPRMKALINSIYPGTPTSFSEWNAALAGETDFSTALVDVDAWGIFGRENLYAASRWTASATTSPAYYSLLMYRNYDGHDSTFGTTSIQATNTASPNLFSSYAALNAAGTQMTVMLVNKDPNDTAQVTLSAGSFTPSSIAEYTLSQSHPSGIVASGPLPVTNTFTLPPYTAMLIVANGSLQKSPAVEWALNPDETMVPAKGTVTLSPTILSGTGTVTLSNPQLLLSNPTNTTGISVALPTPQITNSQPGSIVITGNSTPGFYQFSVDGTDNSGVTQTQTGWILVQNPAAALSKIGDGQTGAVGTNLTLTATLQPGSSGGSTTGASIFFTTNAGTLSAREVTTNSAGQASVTLTLPSVPGTVTVTAEGQYGLGHPVATFTETAQ
jgi:hypothetical protein